MCKSPKLENLSAALKLVLWFVSRSKLLYFLQSNCWLLLLLFTLAHADHGGLLSAGTVGRFKFTLIKLKYPAERLRFSIVLMKYVTLGQELLSIWHAQSMGLSRISVVCNNPYGCTQVFWGPNTWNKNLVKIQFHLNNACSSVNKHRVHGTTCR